MNMEGSPAMPTESVRKILHLAANCLSSITMQQGFSAPGERNVKYKCGNKAECRRIKYILYACHCVPKNGFAFLLFECGEEFSTFDYLNCV